MIYLTTRRLFLRQFTRADVDALAELNSDPDVMRFLTGGKPISRGEVAGEVLPSYLRAYERSDRFGVWAAVEQDTGDFVGWFALTPPGGVSAIGRPDDQTAAPASPRRPIVADLGYRLRKSAWGKGLATEGARALIRKAFTDLGVDRVTAQTMAVNTASRRVMERAGLRHVRSWHQEWDDPIPGTEQGEVEYALDREEWRGGSGEVGFRRLQRADLAELALWLSDSEVRRWWPGPTDAGTLEAKYGPRIDGGATEVFVVEVDGLPSGIVQRYRVADYSDWSVTLGRAAPLLSGASAAGIDYLLGRPDVRGWGVGTRLVGSFTARLFDEMPDVDVVVVAVQQENRSSWRALERAGYRRIWAGQLESDDPSDAGPAFLLVRRRPAERPAKETGNTGCASLCDGGSRGADQTGLNTDAEDIEI